VRQTRRYVRSTLLLVCAVSLLAGLAAGCASVQMQSETAKSAAMNAKSVAAGQSGSGSMQGMASDANSQGCSACTTGKERTPAEGTVETVNGTQVATVGIVDGYYTPNRFVAKSGMPMQVVFKVKGKPAKACVSKPKFKSLGKATSITEGEKTIDLGVLSPGTYEFTCGMGANKGTITVE
jgi:opacity protein-like surface antigen